MKVCLIYPSVFFRDTPGVSLSQQLFYLYSHLRHNAPEVQVEILDLSQEIGHPRTPDEIRVFMEETERLLARTDFDVAGISCWTTHNYLTTMAIAGLCRRMNPGATVVVGGYHPTFTPQDFCEPGSPVDFVVRGDGEIPLLQIATGKVRRDGTTQVLQGTPLPMEEHTLLWGENKYHQHLDAIPIWLSRGCPFACGFCLDRLSGWRAMPARAALDELRRLAREVPRARAVVFYDPLFGVQKEWRREFLAGLIEADLPLHYWAESRVDLIEPEDVDLLARLPFRLDMGLESVVPEMLAIMKKTNEPARYLQRFREVDACMNRKRVVHVLNHIYNYPGETPRTLETSLRFWQDYYQGFEGDCYAYVSVNRFKLYPGSETWDHWAEYEQQYGARILHPEWWKELSQRYEVLSGDIVPSRELAEANQLGYSLEVSRAVTGLAMGRAKLEAFRPFVIQPPAQWADSVFLSGRREGYLDDKPLRLGERTAMHRKIDGTVSLHDFAGGAGVDGNRAATDMLLKVVEEGRTIADLAAQAAIYPNPEAQLQRIRRFFLDLYAKGLLQVAYPPPPEAPPPGEPLLRLDTDLGPILVRLYPAAAPRAAASFLYLAAAGYYDSLLFKTTRPSVYLEFGAYTAYGDGPGYRLPLETNDLPPGRGALATVREGIVAHGSRVCILRRAAPPDHPTGTVFGQVERGLEVLDALLPNSRLLRVAPAEAPPVPAVDLPGTPLQHLQVP